MLWKIIAFLQLFNNKSQILFHRFVALRKLNIYNNSQNQPIRGHALLMYIVQPFYYQENDPRFRAHINARNACLIAKVLNDLGFSVDVIGYLDKYFTTNKRYDLVIGIGEAFDTEKDYFRNSKIKIYYATGLHYIAESNLIYQRYLNLRNRKGIFISPIRVNNPYFSPEKSDYIISVQNRFTNNTYSHLNIPLYELTLSGTEPDSPDKLVRTKNSKTILWLSGHGMVLKGLDLVLDAVYQVKDCRLIIFASLSEDKEFEALYHKELYASPNISFEGFVDVASEKFKKIVAECVGVICPYPEGEMSGSLMTCMNHGLIPIIAYFSSDEIAEFAEYVDGTVEGIRDTLTRFCQLPDDQISEKSRKTIEYVHRYHSVDKEYSDWKNALEDILKKSDFSEPMKKNLS